MATGVVKVARRELVLSHPCARKNAQGWAWGFLQSQVPKCQGPRRPGILGCETGKGNKAYGKGRETHYSETDVVL